MQLITKHARNPFIILMVGAVSAGLGGLGFMGYHKLKNDPTLVWYNKRENPHPWTRVGPNQNIKLYAVNQKFEKETEPRTTFL